VRVPNVPLTNDGPWGPRPRTISLDLDTGDVQIRNLKTPDLTLEELDVRVPEAGHLVENMVNIQSLLAGKGKLELPSLKSLETAPVAVEAARIKLPEETVNEALQQIGGPILAEKGIVDASIALEEGKIVVSGTLDKLIDVPFRIEGALSAANDKQLRFSLEKTRVLGFLPVPRLVTDIFTAMASREMEKANVRQEGDDFLLDVGAFLPKNVAVGLKSISAHDGYLMVEAGPPQP